MRRVWPYIPEVFLGAFLAVAIFAMGMLFSYPPQTPIHQPQQSQTNENAKDGSTIDGAKKPANPEEKSAEWWMVALTIPVAIATVGLWWIAVRTARRQLRAYVLVDDGYVIWDNASGTAKVSVLIKNYGQTPAYDFRVWIKAAINNTGPPFAQTGAFEPDSIIGPGGHFRGDTDIVAHANALPLIVARSVTVYVWGRAEYLDAFGAKRHTVIRCRMNGPLARIERGNAAAQGWGLSPDPSGYEAN